MKVLITGIGGFVGSHLTELLLSKKGIDVFGIERWKASTENIEHIKDQIKFYGECDINDIVSMRDILKKIKPDYIIHLAAQSFVPTSWTAPAETLKTNIIGQVNLFEALRSLELNPRILIAGSSEEYGYVKKNEVPIKETHDLRPLSPYAVSKVGQDYLGYQYFRSYGMKIIRTRAFNHSGPRRGEYFACSNFAKQIAMIENGKRRPIIYVGNLDAKRDFTDVRDMVKAYWLLMIKGKPGDVYNISSGKTYSIKQVLNILLKMSKVKIEVKQDPERMRPSDVPILLGDCSKMRKLTGWKPEIPFEKTLKDILEYWRGRV